MLMRTAIAAMFAALTMATVACSDGASRHSLTGPSSLASAAHSEVPDGFSSNSTSASGRATHVGGKGTVASLSGTCPSIAMVVRGVRVTTDDATTFTNGECGNLRPGTKIVVEGDYEDGSVLATSIEIVDQPGGTPVEGDGNVGGVHGTCPTLTMVVSGYPVMTTSETQFTGTGACEDIKPGSRIHVQGTIAGGSVIATSVELLATTQQ